MPVYLLHFHRPIGSTNPRGQAQHYIGYSKNARTFKARIKLHRAGQSQAKIVCYVARQEQNGFDVARVWPDAGRDFEKKLKTGDKNARRLCPICNPGGWHRHRKEEASHAGVRSDQG